MKTLPVDGLRVSEHDKDFHGTLYPTKLDFGRLYHPSVRLGAQDYLLRAVLSLDVDFDHLYTEAAPLDALIQRFGRVNRRGAKGIVEVVVTTPESDLPYEADVLAASLAVLSELDGQVLHEDQWTDWLDRVYGGDIQSRLETEYRKGARAFRRYVLSRMRPFRAGESEDFEQLFGGIEILPESLVEVYRERAEESLLEASLCLVPVNRWAAGRQSLVWDRDLRVPVTSAPYSPERGLEL